MLFHLGARKSGIGEFCKRYADSFHRWWDSMDDIRITDAAVGRLTQGIREEQGRRVADDLMAERDALILAMLKAARPLR